MESEKDRGISQEQQIGFLKKILFFEGFDEHELRQFLVVGRWLRVPVGTMVIHEDSVDRVFYILVRGEVAVVKQVESGSEVELTRLHTGDCFGEMSLVTEVKRTAGVKTTEDSYLLMVEAEILNTSNLFLQVKFYRRFCEILVSRLIQANRKMTAGQEAEAESAEHPVAPQPSPEAISDEIPLAARGVAEGKSGVAATGGVGQPSTAGGLPPMPGIIDRVGRVRTQRLIAIERSLPVYPGVARQMKEFLAGEGASSTRKFAALIGLDPVLSLRVLQVANSSYYRRTTAVTSLPHAMVSLGIEHITQLVIEAMATEVRPYFSGNPQVFHRFWMHSLVVARIAELLERVIRANVGVNVYLAGLLHDLGMFALDAVCPNLYVQTLRHGSSVSRQLRPAEREFTGVEHDQAGFWLAEKIGLPEPFCRVIQHHHHPRQAREYRLAVAIVHLANLFAGRRGVCLGEPLEATVNPLESKAWLTLQEEHRPFMDVNVIDFVASFEQELDRVWLALTSPEIALD